MLVIPTPESIYRGNYASLPAATLKPPIEGNRTVPIEVDWLANGQAPQYTIHFNARQQQTLPISQIAALHIDNSQASSSMHVAFPDTQFEVIVGPNTVGFYPVVTNSLEFWCWIDKTPLAQDKTIIQVLNFLPPPIFFTTQPGGTGVGTVREVDTVAPLAGGPITDIGTISLTTPLAINYGGTGSTTPGGALDNLSGAAGATAGTLVRSAGTPGVWSVAAGLSSPISVSNGGTGLTSLAPGNRMLVSNGTGNVIVSPITSDNGTTLQVLPAGNVVVGTATPGAAAGSLTINANGSVPPAGLGGNLVITAADNGFALATLDAFGASAVTEIVGRRSRGTGAAPTAVQGGDTLLSVQGFGRGATTYSSQVSITMAAGENWTDAARGSSMFLGTTPNGTLGPVNSLALAGNNATFSGGVGVGAAAAGPYSNGSLTLNANTVAPLSGPGPSFIYALAANGANAVLTYDAYGTGVSPILLGRRGRGTAAAPTAVQSGDVLSFIAAQGYNGSAFSVLAPTISLSASENWTTTANGNEILFVTVPNGATAGVTSLTLAGNTATFSGNVQIPADLAINATPGAGTAGRLSIGGAATAGFLCAAIGTGPTGSDTTSVFVNFTDFSFANYLGGINRNGSNSVAYVTSSDARLKTDLVESEIGLGAVMAIKVYDYVWAASGEVSHGLVAQEVQTVYPYAVREGGDDPAADPWAIDHGRLTPLLLRAIQQLKAELDALKASLGGN